MNKKAQPHFTPAFFGFLRQLKRHNNREWFMAHKQAYERDVREPFLAFIEDFRPRLHRVSPHFVADSRRTGGSLLRIYRDMRFGPTAIRIKRWPLRVFRMRRTSKRRRLVSICTLSREGPFWVAGCGIQNPKRAIWCARRLPKTPLVGKKL